MDLMNEIITSVQGPVLREKNLLADKSGNHEYIASLAKFGNCYSMVWAHR